MENRNMNGIIEGQKTFQGSSNHPILDPAPNWLTHIPQPQEVRSRQNLASLSFLQNEFADAREYAHWGLNE
jgi:hypothetical protein